MRGKLLFGTGIATGYILGSRSGRAAYEKLKARATALWQSQPVQDKVTAAADAVKEKAPEVSDQLGEAARRAGTVIGSAVRGDGSKETTGGSASNDAGTPAAADSGIPAHSTHPETVNLGTSAAAAASDVESDAELDDQRGQDWSDEGGATPAGVSIHVDPDLGR